MRRVLRARSFTSSLNHCFLTDLVGNSTWFRDFGSCFGHRFWPIPLWILILVIKKWLFQFWSRFWSITLWILILRILIQNSVTFWTQSGQEEVRVRFRRSKKFGFDSVVRDQFLLFSQTASSRNVRIAVCVLLKFLLFPEKKGVYLVRISRKPSLRKAAKPLGQTRSPRPKQTRELPCINSRSGRTSTNPIECVLR